MTFKQQLMTASALWVLAAAIPSQAEAACTATGSTVMSNSTVDCTGTTAAQIGDGTQNNVVVNIVSGATLDGGSGTTINVSDLTLNNYGSVTGFYPVYAPMVPGSVTTVNNYGFMEVSSASGAYAIGSETTLVLFNSGRISSNGIAGAAIGSTDPSVSSEIYNEGTIEGDGWAIYQAGSKPISIINAGILRNTLSGTGPAVVLGPQGDRFEIRSGSNITGYVDAGAGTDGFILGGSVSDTLDLSSLGAAAQFRNFEELEKTGASTWTLTGTSTFAGPTIVQAGQVTVNGSLANSQVTVAGGATLSGAGTVGGILAQTGATLAPGNSIGTLNVAGNVSFAAGSVYQVEVNAAGASDRIEATGQAALSGGTVQVLAENGVYLPSTTYRILTAVGGVSGQFSTVTSNFAFLTPSLNYTGTEVALTLQRKTTPTEPETPTDPTTPTLPTDPTKPVEPTPVAFNSVALSANQHNVANAVEALGSGQPLFNAVIGQSVPGARQALDALSGEAHASAVTTALSTPRMIRDTLLSRLRQPTGSARTVPAAFAADLPGAQPPPVPVTVPTFDPRHFALWGQGFGSWGTVASNGNAAGLDASTGGFVLGAEAVLDPIWRFGLAAGFSRTTFDVDGRLSSGATESVFGALYGSGSWGGLNLRLGTSLAAHDIDTNRTISFPGFADQTSASYDGWTAQAFGEVGHRFQAGLATLEPFVGGSILRLHTNSFVEEGGVAALTGYSRTYDLGTTTLGLRAETQLSADLPVVLRGLVGWRHAYGDVEPAALLAFSNGASSFAVSGVPVDRDALVAEAGLDWQATAAISLGVAYEGQIGSRAQEHAVKGNFTWKF